MLTIGPFLLREFQPGDLDALHRIVSDPAVMQYSDGLEDREEASRRLDKYRTMYRERGFGKWAVVRETEIVGYSGFGEEEIGGRMRPEIAFRLLPRFWGQGWGSLIARGVAQHGWERLGFESFVGFADPENTASRRVMEKIGMDFSGEIRLHGRLYVLYEIGRPIHT